MTEIELLNNTIQHYNSKNRCEKEGWCKYSPKTLDLEGISEGCAIGRFLKPEVAEELDTITLCSIHEIVCTNKKSLLPDWMLKMNPIFLRDVQLLHDQDDNWTIDGLSPKGKYIVELIKDKYNLQDHEKN